jgi:hypothetical protein
VHGGDDMILSEALRAQIRILLLQRAALDQRINDLAMGGALQAGLDPEAIAHIDELTGDVVLREPATAE